MSGPQRFEPGLDQRHGVCSDFARDAFDMVIFEVVSAVDENIAVIKRVIGDRSCPVPGGQGGSDMLHAVVALFVGADLHLTIEIDLQIPALLEAQATGA